MSKKTTKTTILIKEDEYRVDLRLDHPFNLKHEGETPANFLSRRNRLYRKRSYFKDALLAEREVAKVPKLEAAVPITVGDLKFVDDDIHWHLGKVGEDLANKPMEQWPVIFRKNKIGRVVHVSEWIHGTSEHFLYPLGGVQDKVESTSSELLFKKDGSEEIRRTFLVQVLQDGSWCNLFKIAPSSFSRKEGTRKKGGYGLFAARILKAAEMVGLFIGSVRPASKYPMEKRTVYALAARSKGVDVIVDPGRESKGDVSYKMPVFFGIHYANDPQWGIKKEKRTSKHPDYNVEIRSDMRVVTLRDIAFGEEIFLNYEGNYWEEKK
jgi:hypothetical protein